MHAKSGVIGESRWKTSHLSPGPIRQGDALDQNRSHAIRMTKIPHYQCPRSVEKESLKILLVAEHASASSVAKRSFRFSILST